MAEEIERKFLVRGAGWRASERQQRMRQAYLCNTRAYAVRVRIAGESAWFGVKAEREGIRRLEFEYPIPLADAVEMLDSVCTGGEIDKTRHYLRFGEHLWEIDEFHGHNQGLVVAEVELATADEVVRLPPWLGREISTDPRFYNAALVERPFDQWSAAERAAVGPADP